MAAGNFNAALKVILREEGGNDDDPQDHGGRTSRGIIQREWDVYRNTHPGRPGDVWKAAQADIDAIYRNQFWDPWCDKLPSGVDLVFFDFCVNAGRSQAVRTMQRALGVTPVDGSMGMMTLNAVAQADARQLIRTFSAKRRDFYRALRQFSRYGKGWLGRVDRVERTALRLALGPEIIAATAASNAHPEIDTLPDRPEVTVSPRAVATDVKAPPITVEAGAGLATGSSVASEVADQARSASEALGPLADTLTIIKYICIGFAVISAGLTIYALIKNARNRRARHAENRQAIEASRKAVQELKAVVDPLADTVKTMWPVVQAYLVRRWKLAGALIVGTVLLSMLGAAVTAAVSAAAGKAIGWALALAASQSK
jgi:lysozyme family protein